MNLTNYKFHVNGMHCNACVVLTESELMEIPEVKMAKSSLANREVLISGDFTNKSLEQIAEYLSLKLKPHGYTLSVEKQEVKINWQDFKLAVPFALAFVAVFILLQKLEIVNLVTSSKVNFSTAIIIGLIASVSTCMAVVGGLVLSMSANFAKEDENTNISKFAKLKPQILFHSSRLISFIILGGAVGALGSAFQLGQTSTFILSLIVAIVLLILGLNLLDIFPTLKKFQPTVPSYIGKKVHSFKNINHFLTPVLIGTATFFLPCGFTQSMQLYSLSTGSFLSGATIMFSFALGTFPVLALLSFSSLSITKKTQSGVFFKTAGLVVVFFGIFNLINALVAGGFIPPLFSF